ncbi:MAG: efflux RND transporter periplasmic adaptor subunit [Gammaproteobacteria bacterium]|nr:MAG: efflux RND transporter periplasmic adaptor subunit [Gammaproteobacteria bacterium]
MNKSIILTAIVMLVVGLGAGYWFAGGSGGSSPAASTERKPLFYRSPMNPAVTSPVPAKDAMGMDYVPVYADNDGGEKDIPGTVSLDPVVSQSIGVRTAIARRTSITRKIRAVARVDFDEERMARLHPKVEGWISELKVDKTGENVARDAVLLSIYSPRLVSTQQEYLLALKNLRALQSSPIEEIRRGAEELAASSRERLQLFDVPEHQIVELEKSGEIRKNLHIHSPVNGTVIKIGAREGQYVTPKTELYMIVDLSTVWVYADIFEYELPWVRVGDEVEMTLTGIPGRAFTGKVDYIYPYAESRTRSIKVRLTFDNSELLLKPEMFAEVVIKSDEIIDAIVIPAEAVVRSGQSERVFVIRAPGKFEPTVVKLGFQSAGQVAVLSGLEDGDEVVVSAQFLVDSESSLREATSKMMEVVQPEATADTDMEGMDMSSEPAADADMEGMDMSTEPTADTDMEGMDMGGKGGARTDD